jgi:hypothetical protein
MPQYIHDNTEDEFTDFTFINAYLVSKGSTADLAPAPRSVLESVAYRPWS